MKTKDSGNTACGNSTPIDLTLAKLTVTGYDPATEVDEDEWEGGCSGGDFILNFLTASGTLEARYYWIDDGETGPGWYATAGGKVIEGGVESVDFAAGQGVWVLGRGMYLKIPAPEL